MTTLSLNREGKPVKKLKPLYLGLENLNLKNEIIIIIIKRKKNTTKRAKKVAKSNNVKCKKMRKPKKG